MKLCFSNLWRPESEYRVYLAWLELSAAPLHAPRSVPNPLFTLSPEFTTVWRRRATGIIDLCERSVEGGEQWKGLSSGEIRLLEEHREPLPADKSLLATCTLAAGCVCVWRAHSSCTLMSAGARHRRVFVRTENWITSKTLPPTCEAAAVETDNGGRPASIRLGVTP